MTNEEIGTVAGKIWHYLDANGECTIARLKKELGDNDTAILMGLGWLAKEDKLVFVKRASVLSVSLK